MMRLFGRKKKSPTSMVDGCATALEGYLATASGPDGKPKDKARTAFEESVEDLRHNIIGEADAKAEVKPEVRDEIVTCLIKTGLMVRLVKEIAALPFESRKAVSHIFCFLMRKNTAGFQNYIAEGKDDLLTLLVKGYESPAVSLLTGDMLRECIINPILARKMLNSENMTALIEVHAHVSNFEVSSDALKTLRELLTHASNKRVVAEFLTEQYTPFFKTYKALLRSENYVTRRLSLKLLGELLLDRDNRSVMMKYISDRSNLKTIMMMLRDSRPNIQFEAFHVFKVFVANPRKPEEITEILRNNKKKLINYLLKFHNDRSDDEQFLDERALLVQKLNDLPDPDAATLAKLKPVKSAAPAPAAAAPAPATETAAATTDAAAPAPATAGGAGGGAGAS